MELVTPLLTTLLALGFVLALAWVSLRLLRRFQRSGAAPAATLEFVRALPVGARERVVVIRHRGTEYLLGVAAGSVQVLDRFSVGERAEDAAPAADAAAEN